MAHRSPDSVPVAVTDAALATQAPEQQRAAQDVLLLQALMDLAATGRWYQLKSRSLYPNRKKDRRRAWDHRRMRVDFSIIGATVVLAAIASYLGVRRHAVSRIEWRSTGFFQYRGWKMGRLARTLFVVSLLLATLAATDEPMDSVGGQGYWPLLYAYLPIAIAHIAPIEIHNYKVTRASKLNRN